MFDELLHLFRLSRAQFQQKVSSRDESGRRLGDQVLTNLQPGFAAEQSEMRFVVSNFRGETITIIQCNIRRIAENIIEDWVPG